MLSVVAPMSMSEERQRGSLDLLATTTLSTRTIVIGKWLGTFRLVLLLILGPGLVGLALATAHKDTPSGFPPGVPGVVEQSLSSGTLLLAAALLVATILIHGAFLTSLGLALATWINRQSRAIAINVCLFVTMTVGWPILIATIGGRGDNRGILCLSPVWVAGSFADLLSIRGPRVRSVLWWATFWDVEVGALAIGLLWLSVRTFDRCFGRISEHPRLTPLLSDFVVVLAGLLGGGGLFGAIAVWVAGVLPRKESLPISAGTWCATFLTVVGLVLLCATGTMSISGQSAPRLVGGKSDGTISPRRFVLGKWWQTFRLVFLLAIGPGLLAMALATAYQIVLPPPQINTLATGARFVVVDDGSGEPSALRQFPPGPLNAPGTSASGAQAPKPDPAEEYVARIMAERALVPPEPAIGERLSIAATGILTILAHGAVMTSLGLALGVWIRRRGWAIAAGVGVFLLMVVAWPFIALLAGVRTYAMGLIWLSPALAIGILLHHLGMRLDELTEVLIWVQIWDFALFVAAVGLLWLTIRKGERDLRRAHRADDDLRTDSVPEPPARDAVLVGN